MTRLALAIALAAHACSEDHTPPPPGTDAGPPGECTDGATRTASCGSMCGSRTETCRDGAWDTSGPCVAEGICVPAAVESRDAAQCATEIRTCTESCTWSDWGPGNPPGECTPGEETWDNTGCDPGLLRKPVCDETCTWSEPLCIDHCGGTRRVGGADEEVCVPAGFFVRGDETFFESSPRAEVYLDAYYMDRFPVTVARYMEWCSAEPMRCGPPAPSELGRRPDGSLADDYPVHRIDPADAEEFCQWDGGRHMITEAQWEKAIRGPSPRWTGYFWGDEPEIDCIAVEDERCPPDVSYFEYYEYPFTRSFYGAEQLIAPSVFTIVRDHMSSDFYADPRSRTNPLFISEAGDEVARGNLYGIPGIPGSTRIGFRIGNSTLITSFRCAREVE